ncbi:N-acetylglucosamine-6-phosphate deacetylase [Jeotgalibacillus haloalkalitolerans]|uniref:N-acetylglucosamine-6-phosphate deacetylase n=1 Tax=Jeotgalibacillus haloalkalitolerans TaxID=3104292 RepID=A0ABU5KID0_9BACL|nr:N-acetylglucosamine-6-phosphate deacetylase [Jeotgalibacillus sp. HH7-29]MDZ5710991.1 N-acetylglucosamine-6-phosphate deacetylase [Jeotgalibacillus sp. HH7-29]
MENHLSIEHFLQNTKIHISILHGNIASITNKPSNNFIQKIIKIPPTHYLLPGFIDPHIHGAGGADVMDATPEALETMAQTLVKEGVTSFLATTMTQTEEAVLKALRNTADYMKRPAKGAEVLGVHLEGPFLSHEKAGAQDPALMLSPDVKLFQQFQEAADGNIKVVTAAPERENGMTFTKEVSESGVTVSIGHSDATYDELKQAVTAGASQVTHLYNQMSPFHHRDPGVAGGALLEKKVNAEIIADFVHSHPEAVRLAWNEKGADGLILITDAMRAKGLSDGEYDLGGQQVTVTGSEARLVDGTLAGSVLTMDQALKNLMSLTDLSIEELAKITSGNAARQLGVWNRKGSIEPGKDADFVVLDEAYNVVLTICRGEIVFQKEDLPWISSL